MQAAGCATHHYCDYITTAAELWHLLRQLGVLFRRNLSEQQCGERSDKGRDNSQVLCDMTLGLELAIRFD